METEWDDAFLFPVVLDYYLHSDRNLYTMTAVRHGVDSAEGATRESPRRWLVFEGLGHEYRKRLLFYLEYAPESVDPRLVEWFLPEGMEGGTP